MNYHNFVEFLNYDQISLVPVHVSTLEHRAEADTSVQFGPIKLKVPIIAAPMPDVCDYDMAKTLAGLGALGIINRFRPGWGEYGIWHDFPCGVARSLKMADFEWGHYIEDGKFRIICLDTANGANEMVREAVGRLKDKYPDIFIVSGNVATPETFSALQEWGVDAIRVGIAGGSVCETRTETGIYSPMATTVYACNLAKQKSLLIADGGIRTPADMCIAPWMRVLTEDLRWTAASEIKAGDRLIGFDEMPETLRSNGKAARRKFKTVTVQANELHTLPTKRVETDKGFVLVSPDHMWFCQTKKANGFVWKHTANLTPGDKIVYFGKPWETDESREAGWLAGFFDGEGTVSISRKLRLVGFSQVVGELAEKAVGGVFAYTKAAVAPVNRKTKNPKHQDQIHLQIYGLYNQLSFLGRIRPFRLLKKAHILWEGWTVSHMDKATVTGVVEVMATQLYTMTTDSATFITEGFLSHNCKALALGADVVMVGGALAGTKESPGEVVKYEDKLYKRLRGAASFSTQKENTGEEPDYVEGAETLVPYRGSVAKVISRFAAGLRSSMSYADARTLEEYRRNIKVIRVS